MRYSREARKEKINLTHSTLIKPDPSIPISQLRKPIRQLRAILVKTSPGEHHLQSRLLPIFLPIFSDEPSKRPRENKKGKCQERKKERKKEAGTPAERNLNHPAGLDELSPVQFTSNA